MTFEGETGTMADIDFYLQPVPRKYRAAIGAQVMGVLHAFAIAAEPSELTELYKERRLESYVEDAQTWTLVYRVGEERSTLIRVRLNYEAESITWEAFPDKLAMAGLAPDELTVLHTHVSKIARISNDD
jgi:hypothetical protein